MLVWAFALLLILNHLKVNIIALVTALGVGRVAIAHAVQNILDNLFAWPSIILDKPSVVGDHIVVNDAMGTLAHNLRQACARRAIAAQGTQRSGSLAALSCDRERAVLWTSLAWSAMHNTQSNQDS